MRKVHSAYIVVAVDSNEDIINTYTSLVQVCVGLGYKEGDNSDYRRLHRRFLKTKHDKNPRISDRSIEGKEVVIYKSTVNQKIKKDKKDEEQRK